MVGVPPTQEPAMPCAFPAMPATMPALPSELCIQYLGRYSTWGGAMPAMLLLYTDAWAVFCTCPCLPPGDANHTCIPAYP